MSRVFLIGCEVSGSSPKLRQDGFAGAFVTCIVRENNIIGAIKLALSALDEDEYEVVDTDQANVYEKEDWVEEPEIIEAANATFKDGEVRYSRFDAWGH